MKIHLFGNGKMGSAVAALAKRKGWESTPLEQAEVGIDFSHPSVLMKHLHEAAAKKLPLIIGTTGWEEREEDVISFVKKEKMGVVASPNFSIGIYLMKEILKEASKAVAPFREYEVAGIEVHHSQKIDAPSGTAIALGKVVDAHFAREKKCLFTSVRVGSVPGEHTIVFDSPFDTITLTHTARNREGLAEGVLLAASWIKGKTGYYTFEECLNGL